MIKGMIFDLDGTLVDSLSVTFDAFNHGITKQGGRVHTPEEIMTYFGPGEGEIFAQIVGAEKAAAAYEDCRSYVDENLANIPLHQGVEELLQTIREARIPISIFTGRSWNTTEMILKHHDLFGHFVTVVANDHVNSPKPSPEGIHLALSRMNLQPHEVLYIGDSPVDMIASKSAGSKGVAALWDLLAQKNLLEPHQPDHWASHPRDVWAFFQKNQNDQK